MLSYSVISYLYVSANGKLLSTVGVPFQNFLSRKWRIIMLINAVTVFKMAGRIELSAK